MEFLVDRKQEKLTFYFSYISNIFKIIKFKVLSLSNYFLKNITCLKMGLQKLHREVSQSKLPTERKISYTDGKYLSCGTHQIYSGLQQNNIYSKVKLTIACCCEIVCHIFSKGENIPSTVIETSL